MWSQPNEVVIGWYHLLNGLQLFYDNGENTGSNLLKALIDALMRLTYVSLKSHVHIDIPDVTCVEFENVLFHK